MSTRRKVIKKTPPKKSGGCLNGCAILLGVITALAFLAAYFLFNSLSPKAYKELERSYVTETEFFQSIAPLAQETGKKYDLFPSVMLAQAALESGYGNSQLAKTYHNYFGIKATGDNGVVLETQEVEEGQFHTQDQAFATYDSIGESFDAYGKLITKAPRYAKVKEAVTPQEAAYALQPAGYSTNPRYGDLLWNLMEKYNLMQYDPGYVEPEITD